MNEFIGKTSIGEEMSQIRKSDRLLSKSVNAVPILKSPKKRKRVASKKSKRKSKKKKVKAKPKKVIGKKVECKKTTRKRFGNWERNTIASNQDWRCNFCKKKFGPNWEIDHLVPLQFSGSNRYKNLQALCADCHRFKTLYLDISIIKPILSELSKEDIIVREEIEQIQQDHLFKMMCRDEPIYDCLLTDKAS